ncbi:MAG: hypothetical protein WC980_10450 [Candidatus Brocadiia bacterium]
MIKNILLALSIIANIALIIMLVPSSTDIAKKGDANAERNLAESIDSYKKELVQLKLAKEDLSRQVAVLKSEVTLRNSSRVSGTSTSNITLISGQLVEGGSSASSAPESVTKTAERAIKMQELGRLLARLNTLTPQLGRGRGSDPERMKLTGEMMKIMGELEIEDFNRLVFSGDLGIMSNPDNRKLFVNVAIGLFEQMGKPMTPEQVARYESTLDQLAGLDKSITNDSQNATERMIARLQNANAINAILTEMTGIFTPDQVAVVQGNNMGGGRNGPDRSIFPSQMDMLKPSAQSMTVSNTKERTSAADQITNRWARDAASREAIKPLANQYISDYALLKKSLESSYGKETMDYYLERNRSTGAGGGRGSQQTYNQTKDSYIQSNPGYEAAKVAMDIQFLQLQNKYQKEAAKVTSAITTTAQPSGSAVPASAPGGPMGGRGGGRAVVMHFPNLD